MPLLIGEPQGGGIGHMSAYGLFIYLTLFSLGVFVVAQRRTWPVFPSLSLIGAHAGAAYVFRVSHGLLGWTLAYLVLITTGMMWVAIARRENEGANYSVRSAIAGCLITGVVMLAGGRGSLYVPYLYLLALPGTLLILDRALD